MMKLSGNTYVKLHRKIMDWEWYSDPKTLKLFIHLLLTVSIKEAEWHGITIPRGARVISYATLAEELLFTKREIRTHLGRLESTQEVTRTAHSKFSIITVSNYDKYQAQRQGARPANDTQSDNEATRKRQQYKKNKEDKEDKETRARARENVFPRGEFTPLEETPEERAERIAKLKE